MILTYFSENKLEIVIESAQICLISDIRNEYMWASLSEKKHLFMKNLSKHSIKTYMKLCWEVDVSFETVS